MRKLLIVTDAWHPQTNGVVTTLTKVAAELEQLGIGVRVIHPGLFRTLPLPSYPEIRVPLDVWRVARMVEDDPPDTIHIATEGTLGIAARRYCARRGLAFTTSLHTKFPEYLHHRIRLPLSVGYHFLRWFHAPATTTLVTTPTHRDELESHGFEHLVVWGRGVDTVAFHPAAHSPRTRPRLLYVGRVAVEKNLEAFLSLECDADKIVVGDGPARETLEKRYPNVTWLGYRYGAELAALYADADVFVFPSLTDTFGLVMLEANACGTPIAAFPVTGPRDVVEEGTNGALDTDLKAAITRALAIDRSGCRAFAERHGWRAIAERMAANLAPARRYNPASCYAPRNLRTSNPS